MPITRLSLTDFRSYPALAIAAAPGAIVLTGENGAGKTNILDAISLLGPGRGLRGAALSDAARSGGPGGWSIAATLLADGADVELGTGTAASAPQRRLVRINGATATAAALGEWLALVWLTPAMDRLFATPMTRPRLPAIKPLLSLILIRPECGKAGCFPAAGYLTHVSGEVHRKPCAAAARLRHMAAGLSRWLIRSHCGWHKHPEPQESTWQ